MSVNSLSCFMHLGSDANHLERLMVKSRIAMEGTSSIWLIDWRKETAASGSSIGKITGEDVF